MQRNIVRGSPFHDGGHVLRRGRPGRNAAPRRPGRRLRADLLPQCLDALRPPVTGAVAEAQLRTGQRCAVRPGTQIAGVEQGEPDAGVGGAVDQRPAPWRWGRRSGRRRHRGARSGTRRPTVIPASAISAYTARAESPVAVGVEPLGGAVHQVAPGPERSAVALGAGRAAPGGRRASARWPDPGMTSPRSRCEPGCAVVSGVDRGDPAVGDGEQDAVGDGIAAEPGVFTPPRVCHRCHPVRHHVGQRHRALVAVGWSLRTPSGECDTPVGLRTNSIAVGTTRRQDAGVVPGLGGQHRDVAEVGQRPLQPRPRARGKLDDRRDRFGGRPSSSMPSAAACCRASAVISSTSDRSVASSAARASSQAVHRRRDRVGPVGRDDDLAERRDRLVGGGQRPRRVHRRGEREHRVAPVDQPGGARVVRLAAERELPPPVRPDGRRDGDRAVDEVQRAALFDVQFDEDADAVGQASGRRRGARGRGPRSSSPRPA